jgi:hypothetical protein
MLKLRAARKGPSHDPDRRTRVAAMAVNKFTSVRIGVFYLFSGLEEHAD